MIDDFGAGFLQRNAELVEAGFLDRELSVDILVGCIMEARFGSFRYSWGLVVYFCFCVCSRLCSGTSHCSGCKARDPKLVLL